MSAIKRFFGPSRSEIWNRLCTEIGAEYVKGGFWKGDLVRATANDWTVILDTYFCHASKQTYTRLRAPFTNRDQFEFQIYRRGFFSDLAKRLGMQDIEVGHPDFDRDFIVKGSNESKLRQLFENARIREFVSAQPRIDFKIETGEPRPGSIESEAELKFTSVGVIKDVDRLKQLFDLFAETLDQLNRMGTASPPPTEGART